MSLACLLLNNDFMLRQQTAHIVREQGCPAFLDISSAVLCGGSGDC